MRFALAAFAALLVAAPSAQARDATIISFDGTPIVLSLHLSPSGAKAPTILEGHAARQGRPPAGDGGRQAREGQARQGRHRPPRQAKGTVTVKVTAKRKGRTVRETRVYKTCTPRTRR